MSNKTFTMPRDQVLCTVPLPRGDAQLNLSAQSPYRKSQQSLSPSPDSNSSSADLSDRDTNSSPDVSMRECCLSDSSPVDNYTVTLPQGNALCGVSANLNQTFIATPVNDRVNYWNVNLSSMCDRQTGSERHPTQIGCSCAAVSPDSAGRESRLCSCETSRRGSTENDCCSLSSGEMVIRSNSFCLEDQSLLVVSSLEESSVSLTAGGLPLPAESNLLSVTLDVGEKYPERLAEENAGHPCLGMTFTQAELPTPQEDDIAASNCLVALPSEKEGGLLLTFVCETSPADFGKEARFADNAQLLFPEVLTPEQGKSFVSTLSAVPDADKDVQTSTPIQNTENKTPSLPSFSESPCTGSAAGAGLHSVKQQQASLTCKRLVAGLASSAGKMKKMDIKKFPKPDFSSVKSKVVTRNLHPVSEHRPSQANVNNKQPEAQTKETKTRTRTSSAAGSTPTKTANGAQRQANAGAANWTMMRPSGQPAIDGQSKSGGCPPSHHPTTNKHASATFCCNSISETEHAVSSQSTVAAAQHAGRQTLCPPSFEKSPDRSGQKDPKPTPAKCVSNKIEVGTGSALGRGKPAFLKTRTRCLSESSSSSPRLLKEKKAILRFSKSFIIPRADTFISQTKHGDPNNSSQKKQPNQAEPTNGPVEDTTREVKKIGLVVESSKSATPGASWGRGTEKFREQPSPQRTRGASAARPRPPSLLTRQRQPTLRRDEGKTSKAAETPQSKQKSSIGSRAQATGEPSPGNASIKVLHTRTSLVGLPPTPASRLSRKTPGRTSVSRELSEGAGSTQVSGGAAQKTTPSKTVALKARLFSTPAKHAGQPLAKPAASLSKGASSSTVSPPKRPTSTRFVGLASSRHVDKNKPKPSFRQQPPQQQVSQLSQGNGPPDVVPGSASEAGIKDQSIQQLKGHLAASNSRFEAVAIVLQQTLTERDEATRQCRDLSQELVNLRGELVCSIHSSERLEKEKEELRVALEDVLQKLQEQHQKDLAELEHRLQAFYQAEWDKVHQTYQEEADKCKSLMQQQMGELRANHEAMKQELENSHTEQLQCVQEQYEMSLEELSKVHNQELQTLDKTLKDTEAALAGQIEVLTEENKALIEKLTAEETRRKELAEKSPKDSHTLYLEQELESLKVVLDIKNKQLHQQEKKMMELDKLKDKNVMLDESLKKVQQENEDLKARMDRHAALSRQLSTEQAALQESLQKESKVNKRLSMENEELLWKLHNGDMSSPRRVSPTSASPSHSFGCQSPRSSGLFSSPPVSPR